MGGPFCFSPAPEVESLYGYPVIDRVAMLQSTETARAIKALTKNLVTSFTAGYQPPSILSYVVGYDGPASMTTVHGWFAGIHAELGVDYPPMPPNGEQRISIASPSLDAVFLLGRGFIQFDNSPFGFITNELRQARPNLHWAIADTPNGNLLLLFMLLSQAISGVSGSWLNAGPYVTNFNIANVRVAA